MICILYQTYYDGQMEKDDLGVVCVTCERKTGMRAGKGLGVNFFIRMVLRVTGLRRDHDWFHLAKEIKLAGFVGIFLTSWGVVGVGT